MSNKNLSKSKPVVLDKETTPTPMAAIAETEEQEIQNTSKEVIQHLSKEIEITTNNLMIFRSKISLAIFLGPFIVLGSVIVATKGLSVTFNWNLWVIIAMFIQGACFMTLAYTNAAIEQHGWDQCHKWRRLIGKVHNNPSLDIQNDPDLSYTHKAIRLYFATYSLLLLSFIITIFIITRFNISESSANSTKPNVSIPAQPASTPP